MHQVCRAATLFLRPHRRGYSSCSLAKLKARKAWGKARRERELTLRLLQLERHVLSLPSTTSPNSPCRAPARNHPAQHRRVLLHEPDGAQSCAEDVLAGLQLRECVQAELFAGILVYEKLEHGDDPLRWFIWSHDLPRLLLLVLENNSELASKVGDYKWRLLL